MYIWYEPPGQDTVIVSGVLSLLQSELSIAGVKTVDRW